MAADQQQLLDPGPAGPRADKRRQLDAYLTPMRATAALIEHLPELRGQTLLDPCCGDGRMALQLAQAGRFSRVHLNDVHEERLAHAEGVLRSAGVSVWTSRRDAADPGLYVPAPDLTATNPPWSAAGDIARAALRHTRRMVALLLRQTWLEPCGASPRAPRGDRRWLVQLPPTRLINVGRISYSGDGATDSAPSAWFIWCREPGGPWQRGTIEIVGREDGAQLALPEGELHAE